MIERFQSGRSGHKRSSDLEWQQRLFGAGALDQEALGWRGSGRRQGVSLVGTMRGPRLSTWRLFLFFSQKFERQKRDEARLPLQPNPVISVS